LVECGDNSHPISTAAVTMMMAVTNTTIKISPELITVGYLIYLYFILLLFFLLYNLLIISFDRKKNCTSCEIQFANYDASICNNDFMKTNTTQAKEICRRALWLSSISMKTLFDFITFALFNLVLI
jgi:hypothetical protein